MIGRIIKKIERETERERKSLSGPASVERCGVYTSSYSFNLLKSEGNYGRKGKFCCIQK